MWSSTAGWVLHSKILGLVIFLGAHVFVTMRDHRAALVARIGEWPYRGLFSLVSIAGIVLIGYGFAAYRAAGPIMVWIRGWTRHIVVALMWPASIMVAAVEHLPADQTRAQAPDAGRREDLGVRAFVCQRRSRRMILFGSVLASAVYDRITLKHRKDAGAPPISVGGTKNDIIAIVVGTVIYLALGFVFHPIVIGVWAFGTPALGH